ncbi:hypothetical protein GCM10025772_27760 [Ferrimonas gelatinilytica]|uniref:Uncharacterized protein n=2 Tax=Ferrimonas gelatinilytica TaxID=1255257 RepID=A0ABP9SFR0_9GAMM
MAAFDIAWHEKPKKIIRSFIPGGPRLLTKPGMANFAETNQASYREMLAEIG